MCASKTSDAGLTNLFLDMLAAEQGAGENTIEAYRHDLTDFSEFCARSGQSFASVRTETLRDYLGDLDTRGFKSSSVARRSPRPGASSEVASIRLVLPAPFGPVSTTSDAATSICAAW